MSKTVEFFFDIVSPASYLAWTQMPALASRTGAEINYRPFFLPGVFQEAGSSSPITVPAKGRWLLKDLRRHAKMYGVPFNMNQNFPLSSLYPMRGLIAYKGTDQFVELGNGFFQAMWVDDEDITDPAIAQKIVEKAGIDPAEYTARINDPEVKQSVFDTTKEAVERGVFGAPTFFVGETMHWGQDRLDMVEEDLIA